MKVFRVPSKISCVPLVCHPWPILTRPAAAAPLRQRKKQTVLAEFILSTGIPARVFLKILIFLSYLSNYCNIYSPGEHNDNRLGLLTGESS